MVAVDEGLAYHRDGMAKRGGSSLSVRMILTTTLLVIVTVVGSGVLAVSNIRGVFDDATARQNAEFQRSRDRLGELGTPLFARAVTSMLAHRGQDELIVKLTESTVRQDTKEGPPEAAGAKDYGLRLAFVLDHERRMVAHCVEGATLVCKDGGHRPIGPEFGQLTVTLWRDILAAWQSAKSPLAVVEGERDGARYRVYAMPVFDQVPPTAAGALAEAAPPERLGYIVLAYDLAPLAWYAIATERQRDEASKRAVLYTAAVGALFALIGTVLAILQGLSISRPIKQLAYRADQIARGDLQARVEITSTDEIGVLGKSFNYMADQIRVLLEQTTEKARIEQELEVAKAIQETLVPSREPVDRPIVKLAGYYLAAAQTGGDWWTYSELVDGKTLVVIGDVTGHGVPSAMITAAAKAACDVARHVDADVSVSRLLAIMNHAIHESARRRFVMTCFASVIDPVAHTITFANAGHNFPYLYRTADGKGEFGSLMIRGNRLGDDPASRYEEKVMPLHPGDVIVWYTDGIVECESASGEEYGERRFRATVKKVSALDAAEMRDAIVRDALAYYGDTPRKDDITMVVGRIQ